MNQTKLSKMAITSIAIGTPREASQPDTVKAALAEFFSVFIFIFAGQGSAIAVTSRLGQEDPMSPARLLLVALAHAFALFVAVSVSANTSGGHVNPAVTFAAFLGGSITLLRALVYVVAQLSASLSACFLLTYATGGREVVAFGLGAGVSPWSAVALEVGMTFGLVYTVHATTVDPKRGDMRIVAPIAIGFIVGANILAGGAFDGASMNPAGSFGPAVVGWSWANHWVYWVGPLVGAAMATTVYHTIFMGDLDHQPLPTIASEEF